MLGEGLGKRYLAPQSDYATAQSSPPARYGSRSSCLIARHISGDEDGVA